MGRDDDDGGGAELGAAVVAGGVDEAGGAATADDAGLEAVKTTRGALGATLAAAPTKLDGALADVRVTTVGALEIGAEIDAAADDGGGASAGAALLELRRARPAPTPARPTTTATAASLRFVPGGLASDVAGAGRGFFETRS